VYKPVDPVEQNDLKFLIPGDTDTYVDLDINLYVRYVGLELRDNVDLTDRTDVTNNLLHTLFIQCTVTLNVVPVTQLHEYYNYLAYLEFLDLLLRCISITSHDLLLVPRYW